MIFTVSYEACVSVQRKSNSYDLLIWQVLSLTCLSVEKKKINLGFWETATYPSLTLKLCSHLVQNDGLGEGWVGSFPETQIDPKKSPKRMHLSLIFWIGFGFLLFSDLPISGWSGFPHFRCFVYPSFQVSDLGVNLHLTVQSRLNRKYIGGSDPKRNCLIVFLNLEQSLSSGKLFYRAI